METLTVLAVVILSYLLGSTPTAYLVAKTQKVDIFKVGSGNMGATNVTRALGFRWGLFVMLIDILKGVVAIYLSRQILHDNKALATTLSAITVVIGHNWSLFATILTGTLRGGKGAATTFGTLLMVAPIPVIITTAIIAGVIIAITRYVSLAVLVAFSLATLWMIVLILQEQLESILLLYILTIAVMIFVRFRPNIQRLANGTERRLGERA
ncbi:MAG: glycerol-3-phosphate 1-O-acyltransferase PlsY [Anaerolineae bacterium]